MLRKGTVPICPQIQRSKTVAKTVRMSLISILKMLWVTHCAYSNQVGWTLTYWSQMMHKFYSTSTWTMRVSLARRPLSLKAARIARAMTKAISCTPYSSISILCVRITPCCFCLLRQDYPKCFQMSCCYWSCKCLR